MRMIEFNVSKKAVIYLNPDKVQTVTPYGDNKCLIRLLDDYAIVVLHSAKDTVSLLTKTSASVFE